MKVKDLIKELEKLPKDSEIGISNYDDSFSYINDLASSFEIKPLCDLENVKCNNPFKCDYYLD